MRPLSQIRRRTVRPSPMAAPDVSLSLLPDSYFAREPVSQRVGLRQIQLWGGLLMQRMIALITHRLFLWAANLVAASLR